MNAAANWIDREAPRELRPLESEPSLRHAVCRALKASSGSKVEPPTSAAQKVGKLSSRNVQVNVRSNYVGE